MTHFVAAAVAVLRKGGDEKDGDEKDGDEKGWERGTGTESILV